MKAAPTYTTICFTVAICTLAFVSGLHDRRLKRLEAGKVTQSQLDTAVVAAILESRDFQLDVLPGGAVEVRLPLPVDGKGVMHRCFGHRLDGDWYFDCRPLGGTRVTRVVDRADHGEP